MINSCRGLACLGLLISGSVAAAGGPTPTDDRLVVELVAREPEIVTPTGLAVDEAGAVWVIENNTHERPATYQGPPTDRVRVFSDFGPDGKARSVRTFAEGFRNSMSLALGKGGAVYLATRSDIHLLRDRDGDGKADERRVIVRLETAGAYPHNGLSGLCFGPRGDLYFALGENLGADYKLVGSDGTTYEGGGEGGSIYRCRPDGSGLVRVATGFWNTFALAFDAFGRLFAVDNDPDSRGPCRLLHVVSGGDYGFRFRNGRKGLHPFIAWNGELPGTLPMVAGTAEAPSGLVAYESDGLPADYRGTLLSTSWGDHVLERFTLSPRGASFSALSHVMVRGGDDFRPVAIATAPDGSLYLSDWVDKSYPVHGKGRIWHIRMKQRPAEDCLRASAVASLDIGKLRPLLHHARREVRAAAGEALAGKGMAGAEVLKDVLLHDADPRARVQVLWAAAGLEPAVAKPLIAGALLDRAPEVRGEAAHLLGEVFPPGSDKETGPDSLLGLATRDPSSFVRMQAILQLRSRSALQAILPVLADPDPFLASAAIEVLGRPGNSSLLLPRLDSRDARLRLGILVALRRTGDAEGRAALPRMMAAPDPAVRRAAIQWVGEERLREFAPLLKGAASRPPVTRDLFEALLAARQMLEGGQHPGGESSGEEYVARVVRDPSEPAAIRAVALRMLRPDHPALTPAVLRDFLKAPEPALRREAIRALALRTDDASQEVLRQVASDRSAALAVRELAILGLANSAPGSEGSRRLLLSSLEDPALRREALRSLRGAGALVEVDREVLTWWERSLAVQSFAPDERQELAEQVLFVAQADRSREDQGRLHAVAAAAGPRPRTGQEWQTVLAGAGDAEAGERVFFHPNGPRCAVCHRIDGRGGQIGPDLSTIGSSLSREKLIESVLEPSKEIAPRFVSWLVTTRDGKERTGVIVEEGADSTVTLADAQGKLEVIHRTVIEDRQALPTSLMPDNLPALMTRREFRDLIAFLQERK